MAINLNSTLPAAPAGSNNVVWAEDASGNVSASVPSSAVVQTELALTGQGANVGVTNLVASVPNNARYRVTVYIIITTVDSVSSTLPSVTLAWKDADNSTNQTLTLVASQTGNLLTTKGSATTLISAQSASAISVSTASYASNTPSQMKFSLYVETELL